MKLFYTAAFVAYVQAGDHELTYKDMEDLVDGFLHGLGYTRDVMSCFGGTIGDNLEEVMTHFLESHDCQVDIYTVNMDTVWGLKNCFSDVANITKNIGDGLQQCTEFDFTSEDKAMFRKLQRKLRNPIGIVMKLGRDLLNFSSGALTKYMREIDLMIKASANLDFDAFGEHMGKLVSEITGVMHH